MGTQGQASLTVMRMAMSADRAYCSWLVARMRVRPFMAPRMALLNTARPTWKCKTWVRIQA